MDGQVDKRERERNKGGGRERKKISVKCRRHKCYFRKKNDTFVRGEQNIIFFCFAILRSRKVSKLHRYHQYGLVDLRNIRVNGPCTLDAVEDA